MGAVPGLADPAPANGAGRTSPDAVLTAPFPYFGGKSRAAALIWQHLGDVGHYVEPFAGSLAVLLARPNVSGLEVVNDRDCYLSNFWRAVSADPATTAACADWPVNETDLHARHEWLCAQHAFRDRMLEDPEYFDPRIAGWWVWGVSQWIGGGWCERPEWRGRAGGYRAPRGLQRQLSHDGMRQNVYEYFDSLMRRLRGVRVCCGDWARVCKPDPTTRAGITGVLLDPPYSGDRYMVYSHDSMFLAHEVREWAIHAGEDPRFRVALCGELGGEPMPEGWNAVEWKRRGGYAIAPDVERVWFSPHCLPAQLSA